MSDLYSIPFDFPLLPYDSAVAIAHDTGRIGGVGEPLLETVIEMLNELGRPDSHFDCLQIAGTNGKTSTARFTAAILKGEGLKTALYTSPELVHMEERMEVGGRPVSREQFALGVSAAAEAGRRVNERRRDDGLDPFMVTPFDLLTVAALVIFAVAQVDAAVFEVGLGGRWDATSATNPVAVAITGIGLDHMKILGSTLAQIAGEKAAVIKPGRIVVLGEGTHEPSVQAVMDARCRTCGVVPLIANHALLSTPDHLGGEVALSTTTSRAIYTPAFAKPAYQAQNAACAVMLSEAYLGRQLDAVSLERSLAACPTPGRFDVLSNDPLLLVDACHNPQSCDTFVSCVDEIAPRRESRPALLIAVLSDKDVAGIVRSLVPAFPAFAVTRTASERALPAEDLAALIKTELSREGRPRASVRLFDTVADALAWYRQRNLPLVCAGTITLAGEVTGLIRR